MVPRPPPTAICTATARQTVLVAANARRALPSLVPASLALVTVASVDASLAAKL